MLEGADEQPDSARTSPTANLVPKPLTQAPFGHSFRFVNRRCCSCASQSNITHKRTAWPSAPVTGIALALSFRFANSWLRQPFVFYTSSINFFKSWNDMMDFIMALADADEGAYVFVAHQFGSVPS